MKKAKVCSLFLVFLLLLGCTQQTTTDTAAAVSDAVQSSEEAAATTTQQAYTKVDISSLSNPSDLTMTADALWFLAQDETWKYACSVQYDGSGLTTIPLISQTSSSSVNAIAFSDQRVCYATFAYIEDDSGSMTETEAWLYCIDENGDESFALEIDESYATDAGDRYVTSIAFSADGTILFATPNALYQVDTSGNILNALDFSNHEYMLPAGGKEEIFLRDTWDFASLYAFDLETFSIGELAFDVSDYLSVYSGTGAYDLYGIQSDGVYGLAVGEEDTCVLSIENADAVQYAYPLENGRWFLARSNYYNSETALYLMEEVQASWEKTTLTMAVSGLETMDQYVEALVNQFNFENTSYEISVVEYTDKEMQMAVASGVLPDMILFDNSGTWTNATLEAYAQLGMLQDLYTLMDSDEPLSKEMILPNLLSVLEQDGGLYALPYGFQIRTLYVQSGYGASENWSLDEMLEAASTLPESVYVDHYTQTDFLLAMMRSCLSSFVDAQNGTCDFTCDTFYKLLQVSATLPDTYDTFQTDDEHLLNYAFSLTLNILCDAIENAGESVVWTGFPDAGGGQLTVMPMVAITVSCTDMETAWELVRQLVLADGSTWYLSQLCSSVEAELASLQEAYAEDVIDQAAELLYGASTITGYASPIPAIVAEEAAAYFAGDRSAEDVADIIEDRVGTYLAERQ